MSWSALLTGSVLFRFFLRRHPLIIFSLANGFVRSVLVIACLSVPGAWASESAQVSGVIFTAGPGAIRTIWPNARVTLKSGASGYEVATVSNQVGEYLFTGVLPGEYEVSVTLAGFRAVTKRITLKEGGALQTDFQLIPERPGTTVEVTAETSDMHLTSSSGGAPALTASILKSAVRLSEDFQEALPLLPGVVRGPDGVLRIKGGRTNQTNALVNTVSVVDPYTGQPALKLPLVAVQSIRLLSNPFSAEYGSFASGIVEVNTRGGTDQWRWLFEDPVPRLRWIDGSTHGVESASPHLVLAGPIKRNKLYLFQSTSYSYDTFRVRSLPDPDNVRVEERFNTHTQIDWNITPTQLFTAVLTADPQEIDFATINTFNPQPVTADYRQRGFFSSGTHRWILPRGGFIQSIFSAKRLDARVFPADQAAGKMVLFPEQNAGAFFDRQERRTRLYQWFQSFHLWPLEFQGRHLITLGYSYSHGTYRGSVERLPLDVLRGDGTLSQHITHGTAPTSDTYKNELAFFVQDNWQVHPRLVLDLGVRLQMDSLSAEKVEPAPRIGFVFAPGRDNRTAIRGGFGVFFDKIPLNVASFPNLPVQTITRYAADGVTIADGPTAFPHVVATKDSRLRTPYGLGWTLQFDRELRNGLLFRFGYEQREVFRDFYLDPFDPADENPQLRLFNSGRQTYRELLWMLRWQASERTTIYASYVRSKTYGESNDYNEFFGNFSSPLIRPNQTVRLAHDVPDRCLFWGVIGLPRKLEFVPVLDVHSGFPYSRLDEDWNYIGQQNEAGRFPVFIGLDTKIQYPFDFRFHKWHFKFRAGLNVFNVLNHFNPRDVQQHADSRSFGAFYNSIGRLYRIEGDFNF